MPRKGTTTINPDIPLECQVPSEFGEFDEDQKDLISEGAYDLILCENANELVRLVMMKEGNIELVLSELAKYYDENCSITRSETFPLQYVSKGKPIPRSSLTKDEIEDLTGTFEDYMAKVKQMSKEIQQLKRTSRYILGVYATIVEVLDDDTYSGHYGSFFYDSKTKSVLVFDSMEDSKKGSAYTPFFLQLGRDLFGTSKVESPTCNIMQTRNSVQITGGFPESNPTILRTRDKYELIKKFRPNEDPERVMWKLRMQNTESQNHFCYLWAIMILHIRLASASADPRDKNVITPQNAILSLYDRQIDPLIIIKRYIWALFYCPELSLIKKIPLKYRKFFEKNFPAIWTNDIMRKFMFSPAFLTYHRYQLDSDFEKPENFDAILKFTFKNFTVCCVVENTSIPESAKKCVPQKLKVSSNNQQIEFPTFEDETPGKPFVLQIPINKHFKNM